MAEPRVESRVRRMVVIAAPVIALFSVVAGVVAASGSPAHAAAPTGQHIYWGNFAGSFGRAISRANADGSGVDPTFISTDTTPVDPVVDGSHIYWGNYGNPGSIGRANLDGSGVDQTFITGVAGPWQIAVDGAHIYWGNYFGSSIGRANLDGTHVDQGFIATPFHPYGVAVDGGHIYWSNFDSLGRANLDGTGVDQTFVPVNDGVEVAVDGSHVYWGDYLAGTIGRANVDGSGVNQTFITGADHPRGLVVDRAHVYWANFSANTLGRANLDGTGVDESFVASGADGPWGVAVDVEKVPTLLAVRPLLLQLSGLKVYLAPSAVLTRTAPAAPLARRMVSFFAGGALICQATTDASGLARCSGLAPLVQAAGTLGFTAQFAGDSAFLASSGTGPLVR